MCWKGEASPSPMRRNRLALRTWSKPDFLGALTRRGWLLPSEIGQRKRDSRSCSYFKPLTCATTFASAFCKLPSKIRIFISY